MPAPKRAARTGKAAPKNKGSAKPVEEGFITPLAHRQFYPCEMEALLHYNGYDVTALYGDFARGPLVQRSDVMVWHARPAQRGGRTRR